MKDLSKTATAVIFCIAGFFIGGTTLILICSEYLFGHYVNDYYTLNDTIYIERNSNLFHFTNENGGLDLTVYTIKERDHILSILCDPTDSTEEYFERLSTLQSAITGEPRKIIDQRNIKL